jgi:hypothetical protein
MAEERVWRCRSELAIGASFTRIDRNVDPMRCWVELLGGMFGFRTSEYSSIVALSMLTLSFLASENHLDNQSLHWPVNEKPHPWLLVPHPRMPFDRVVALKRHTESHGPIDPYVRNWSQKLVIKYPLLCSLVRTSTNQSRVRKYAHTKPHG